MTGLLFKNITGEQKELYCSQGTPAKQPGSNLLMRAVNLKHMVEEFAWNIRVSFLGPKPL